MTEVLLLGTAAAEAWPCPWCACPACTEARRRGGRDIRTRSGALIDNTLKIDFGPDTFTQLQNAGRDLTQLTTLIFTHAHDDHLVAKELQYRSSGFVTQSPLPPLHIYGSDVVLDAFGESLGTDFAAPMNLVVHPPLLPFQEFTAEDGTVVLPLPAAHSSGAFVLRLNCAGKSLFYGHDSGIYPEKTINALADSPLDVALFDCTYGPIPNEYTGHLGIEGVVDMVGRMRKVGAVTSKTRLIATHFSHNGGMLYDELAAAFATHQIRVAYDGMRFNL